MTAEDTEAMIEAVWIATRYNPHAPMFAHEAEWPAVPDEFQDYFRAIVRAALESSRLRVEKLEAALRKIAGLRFTGHDAGRSEAQTLARAALQGDNR